jgi:hypothetical protein
MSIITTAYKKRLEPLKYHSIQQQIFDDTYKINYRFDLTHAGRRSGKTEIVGKRRFVARVIKGVDAPSPRYFVGAPTRDQAWRMYWKDLKILTKPFQNPEKPPSESRLIIPLKRDIEIHLLGMDKPERIEGSHWDGGILDEYANMKEKTWLEHVRPALSTPGRPPAWCNFVGVPEGRTHYYDLYKKALAEFTEKGLNSEWKVYHWFSSDILSEEEIKSAKDQYDDLTYQQEYQGDFVNFQGRAYYNFFDSTHCAKLSYDPKKPLIFCFDFNVDPGIAVVIQEQNYVDPKTMLPIIGEYITGIIGEVHIPQNSNTVAVCNKLVEDWEGHQSYIYVYGDATGGSRGSAKIQGSDWELVKQILNPAFPGHVIYKVPRSNPRERARVNAMNSRLKSISGEVKLQVDPKKAPNTVKDFEGVSLLKGGSGEIDKKKTPKLSHITDACGYYISKEFPVKVKGPATKKTVGW